MSDLLTAKDMQNLLHVNRSTIYRMAEAGQLPAIKVGKQWRFDRNKIEGWLQVQETDYAAPTVNATPAPLPTAVHSAPYHPVTDTTTELAELLPTECVQLIQNTFANALGIMVIITDMEGQPVTQASNACGLFNAVNDIPDALEQCLAHWREMAHTLDLQPKFTASHLGLLCARAMIRVGAELKGMVFVGGIAPEQWPPDPGKVQAIADAFGATPEILAPHLTDVFYLTEPEKARVLPFVQEMANIVAHIIAERNELMSKLNESQGVLL
jgi:excisionase family DNA binding protein